MTHQRLDLRVETGPLVGAGERSFTLAATVHWPERPAPSAPVLVGLPGGGYNRRYFDLDEPGYSEAAHHVERGTIVIALDHLRVGDSDIPQLETASMPITAAADHAALQVILERLRAGRLAEGRPRVAPAAVIGAGQSMGGHIGVLMQSLHRSFDGLAVMGSSMVCTRLPARIAGQEVCLLGERDVSAALKAMAGYDWRWGFHWDDEPEHLAAVDMAHMTGGPLAPWRSATTPNAGEGLLPGFLAREAASIDVPVLIAMGERDVCQDPLRELAAFISARDLALFVAPRMAHMHNFASTRALLWNRLDAFIAQVAAAKAGD